MAWPTRSKLLTAYTKAGPAANTKYTVFGVPAGKVWLVKSIVIYHTRAGTTTFFGWHTSGATDYVCQQQVIPAGGASADQVLRVFMAGDSYKLQCDNAIAGGRFDVLVYGAELS